MADTYETDTYAWALAQADALKRRASNEIDWDNVAEELESLGKQQVAELRNRLIVLAAHLLKWALQPESRSRSWRLTIKEQRTAIADHLDDNPSLRPVVEAVFARAYRRARLVAARETACDEDGIPSTPPFNFEQALDSGFWPEAVVGEK